MENRDAPKSSPMVSWQALVLMAAIASNLFWATPLLRSSRPSARGTAERALGKQDVDARLWQDPFQALGSPIRNSGMSSNDPAHSINDLALQIRSRGASRVTVLPVMVTGAPYAEDSEWRLRSRYALISGLTVCNYTPEDSQHVGYIRVAWPNDATRLQKADSDPVLVVPYEWYCWADVHSPYAPSERTASDFVLVLWLRDELFTDRPFYRLHGLLAQLQPPGDSEAGAPEITTAILGPYGSTTLQAMVKEAESGVGEYCLAISNTLSQLQTRIYSPSATAPDIFLGKTAEESNGNKTERRGAVRQQLKRFGVQFVNCSCTDDELAEELIEELGRRGLDLTNNTHGVVMISEEDTFYGRALPATFNRQLKKHRPCNEARPYEYVVRHYTYLRGLDGKTASADGMAEKTSSDKKADTVTGRPDSLERPENASQLDYVRRLVERIARECSGGELLGRRSECPELRAIGIVGSDVYDKLLLLQLLRKQFPKVIFFTTDLDARLFHPQELKATRNLLVASSFGLELNPDYQYDIPPFRDTYQTALFLATCLGLGSVRPEVLAANLKPRLFEIGQLGAVDLSIRGTKLHPPRDNYGRWLELAGLSRFAWVLPVAAAISIAQVLPASRRFTLAGKKRKLVARLLALIGAVLLALFLYSLASDYSDPKGEPLLFLSGVSVWPTEILRCVTACFCFFWLLVAAEKLERDRNSLATGFGFPLVPPAPSWSRSFFDRLKIARWKARAADGTPIEVCQGGTRPGTTLFAKSVSAFVLWQDYVFLGRPINRIFRVALASIVYLIFGVCLIKLDPPFVPARGPLSFRVDTILMLILVIGFVVLMFVVVDATRLCTRMVRHLADSPTTWTQDGYDRFQKIRRIPRAYLGDYMDIKFAAARTRTVVRLIYYPFIVIFLVIIARSHFFDAWDWPWGLRILVGLNASYAFCCAAALRMTAENARRMALDRMRAKLALVRAGEIEVDNPVSQPTVEASKEAGSPPKAEKPDLAKDSRGILISRKELETELKELIDEVKGMEEGAFAPWSRQPLVGALIMPFTGAGLLAVLQYLATTH